MKEDFQYKVRAAKTISRKHYRDANRATAPLRPAFITAVIGIGLAFSQNLFDPLKEILSGFNLGEMSLYGPLGALIFGTIALFSVKNMLDAAEHFGTHMKQGLQGWVTPVLLGSLMGITTSLPELGGSFFAALAGDGAAALNNINSSNFFNIAVGIIGITALGLMSFAKDKKKQILSDIPDRDLGRKVNGLFALIAGGALLSVYLLGIPMGVPVGLAFLGGLAAYMGTSLWASRKDMKSEPQESLNDGEMQKIKKQRPLHGFGAVLSFAGLFASAAVLVNAGALALQAAQAPEILLGIFMGLATSAPEFATIRNSIKDGNYSEAAGNAVASGIFNIFKVLGITALISGGIVGNPIDPVATLDLTNPVAKAMVVTSIGAGMLFSSISLALGLVSPKKQTHHQPVIKTTGPFSKHDFVY